MVPQPPVRPNEELNSRIMFRRYALILLGSSLALALAGCGTTKSRTATQQLLMSAAVDDAVAQIDFRPLSGRKVYFDTAYLNNVKGIGFVNADYIISSIRQQMAAASLMLQTKADDAEFIVEARVGTMGTDSNEMVYGLPASSGLSTAASLVPNAPPIPVVPEISIARKESEQAAAKIAVFAYDRDTRKPVWQSGISQAKSKSQDLWVFGAGPFQRGSIYEKTQLAGEEIRIPMLSENADHHTPRVAYHEHYTFGVPVSPARLAQREKIERLIEALPSASVEEWLTPLDPKVQTDLDQRLEWR